MKFFGKLATALLSLSFCFSAFGCADLTNSDLGGNSGNNGGSSGSGEQEQTQIGETLTNAIMGQLEEANTLTFSLELVNLSQNSYKAEEDKADDYYDKIKTEIDATFAKTEKGYDAKLVVTNTNEDLEYGEIVTYTETEIVYFIDGISYEYDEYFDGYIYNPYDNSIEEIPDFDAIFDSFKTEEIEAFKGMLSDALTEVYDVTEGNISFAYDGKDDMNALLDYVGAIDPETKTLESLINDALALIDEELTVASIFAEIEALDTVTVGDAVAAIDEFLTENADTTLQGLKDALIADERIVALLQEQGMTAENIAEIEAIALADVLEPYKDMLLDEIVYNLVAPLIISDFDPEVDSYEVFLNEVLTNAPDEFKELGVDSFITYLTKCIAHEVFNATIAQILGEEGINEISELLAMCEYATMNAFDADMSVEFNEYFQIETISANGNIDITLDDEILTSNVFESFAFSIDSISKDVTEIALPENAKLIFEFWRNDVLLENRSGITLNVPEYDVETKEFTSISGRFDLDCDGLGDVNFEYEAPTEPTNTWEITITNLYFDGHYYSGDELATLLDGDLTYTLTFDFDGTGDYITDFEMPVIE